MESNEQGPQEETSDSFLTTNAKGKKISNPPPTHYGIKRYTIYPPGANQLLKDTPKRRIDQAYALKNLYREIIRGLPKSSKAAVQKIEDDLRALNDTDNETALLIAKIIVNDIEKRIKQNNEELLRNILKKKPDLLYAAKNVGVEMYFEETFRNMESFLTGKADDQKEPATACYLKCSKQCAHGFPALSSSGLIENRDALELQTFLNDHFPGGVKKKYAWCLHNVYGRRIKTSSREKITGLDKGTFLNAVTELRGLKGTKSKKA
jgi:hypothetical protein